MKKIISMIILCIMLLPTVLADGMIIDYYDRYWHIHGEEQQLAAINYQSGYQDMILSVDLNEIRGEKAVWLFPVPANPEKTVIDIVNDVPRFGGYDVKQQAERKIRMTFDTIRASQIYPLPFHRRYFFGTMSTGVLEATGVMAKEAGITIHEHIEKYGLTTELVSTEDGTILWNYLALKGLELPETSKAVMNDYIGEDHSFVVSWISKPEEYVVEPRPDPYPYYRRRRIGVQIMFPTDKIFFPLKPTSVYGSKRVPALLYVNGHVTPELYPEIELDSEVKYFVNNQLRHESFNNVRDYTLIRINPPSKFLTKDLWINNKAPADIARTKIIAEHTFAIGLAVFILASMIASLFAGIIFFRRDVSWIKLAFFGLWNLLTIIGFMIAVVFLKTKQIDSKFAKQLKEKGLIIRARDIRKLGFVIVFSISFVVLTFVFEYSLKLLF
ncbi:hypothetical protein KY331_01785 [Candidatus Woesearchaeota archaeon]|nr:hypothetical protein [Candidatus Woesearchaeota archaeon]